MFENNVPAFLSELVVDLEQIAHEAYEASVLLEEKEAAIAEARSAKQAQEEIARATLKALQQEFPVVGMLLNAASKPQPADPLAAKAWRAAQRARNLILKAAEAALQEQRQKGEAAIRRLLSISEYYRVDADKLRPYPSILDAIAAVKPQQGKSAPKPATRHRAKPAANKTARPVAKKAKKQRGDSSGDILAAAKAWKALGGSALKQRNGEWMFTLADPMLVKIRVRSQSDAEKVIAAVRAAQKAAQTGGNPKAALVAALAL